MGITLKEVAAMAGVHRSTVDKVLHKRPGVSAAVRLRVQAVLEESGYRPNPMGRALQRQSAAIRLSVILLEVDALAFIKQGVCRAVEALHMHNIQVDFKSSPFGDVAAQVALLQAAVAEKVDGIIVSPISAEAVRCEIRRAGEAGIPVVCTNTDVDQTERLCYVGENPAKVSRMAGRMIGEFLGGKGNIAVITSALTDVNNNFFLHVREVEFLAYLKKNYPLIRVAENIESFENPAIISRVTLDMLNRQPNLDGIYIVGGGVCEVGHAIEAAGRAGQIKVVCYEDYPEILELVRQGVVTCTINNNTVQQGQLPVQILIDYLMQDKRPADHVYTPEEILLRECLS